MAVLAIVTSSPSGAEGGHLVLARSLVTAARECGHDARLVVTPDHGFGRLTSSYLANWRTDVGRVDQVISFRYPSYAVRHRAHVCWLNHTMREYYDLWPRFSASISPANLVKESIRRAALHATDRWLLKHHVTKVVAQSHTIQRRLARELGVGADVLWPPAPQRLYRCDGYGDYLFAVSRLTPLKRIDLLIRTLAEAPARDARAVIGGEGESRPDLERLAVELGVADRVTFLGRVDGNAVVEHLARCRAVWFTPFDEDYGLVTAEAFAARKAVITCTDSGGPSELVRDGVTGFVVEPEPLALASAVARLEADLALAERLGASAAEQAAAMTWESAVTRLVIV